MIITPEIRHSIAEELIYELNGKYDGAKKNILSLCPWCAHPGKKFGVYIGLDEGRKRFGASNCYHCNRHYGSLKATLKALGREDLLPTETAQLDDSETDISSMFEDEIDDELVEIAMPRGYKRCYKHPYLKSRGWLMDDYEYFPVGTNRGFDREYNDYVILEIRDSGRLVGFVARSTLGKDEIDSYNARHHFKIKRYKNSCGTGTNGFSKMLYNYDAIEPMATHSVILCEGPFDVVGLNRKLELYDNRHIVPVATFGKKVSLEQMYKLQKKGVEQIVIGYDNDAKETTSRIAMELDKYFDVLIADIPNGVGKDWDEMDVEDIYDVFAFNLKTIREFNLG